MKTVFFCFKSNTLLCLLLLNHGGKLGEHDADSSIKALVGKSDTVVAVDAFTLLQAAHAVHCSAYKFMTVA